MPAETWYGWLRQAGTWRRFDGCLPQPDGRQQGPRRRAGPPPAACAQSQRDAHWR